MIALPAVVVIATARGRTAVPISLERGTPAVAASLLAAPLGLSIQVDGPSATVDVAGTAFTFEIGAPFARAPGVLCPIVGEPYYARDSLYLPLAWVSDCLPRVLASRYSWDADSTRLLERPSVTAGDPNPLTGLRFHHVVVVDPGHGGADPGNPGLYFPSELTEKDITLAIGRLLRAELTRLGIDVMLTRTGDTLIDLHDRPAYCHDDCDLFVSVHVNAMPPGRTQSVAHGVETYFLSDAKTEDQKRVAQMENASIRFETGGPAATGPMSFILNDLQQNEYLRESARLADLVQQRVAAVEPAGADRGVQQAGFWVLNAARRPAILVETGFATNRQDGAFLASIQGERKIAAAIADGIVAYLREFERKVALQGPER